MPESGFDVIACSSRLSSVWGSWPANCTQVDPHWQFDCRRGYRGHSRDQNRNPLRLDNNAWRGVHSESDMSQDENQLKLAAAESAAAQVTDGMIVGLGSGSTAAFAVNALG